MHPVTESVVITHENISTGVLTLAWDAVTDLDLDMLRYRVTASLDSTLAEGTFMDSIVDGTAFEISYQHLFDGLDFLGLSGGEFTWWVSAMDDVHETPASNGPQFVSIDASPVSIFSDLALPQEFSLQQNFPNPFNPITTIRFGLPEAADVHMVIYDIKGRQIQSVVLMAQQPGWYEYVWNGRNTNDQIISTGLYFCRLHAGSYSETIKMVYLK